MTKKIISILVAVVLILPMALITSPTVKALFLDTIDLPDFYKDPQYITDEEFFGFWNLATEDWDTKPLLNYQNPRYATVESHTKNGDYGEAKEALRVAMSEKFKSFPKKPYIRTESSYWKYLMIKHNFTMLDAAGLLSVSDEWGWTEFDITSLISTSDTLKSFYLVSLEKDDSEIEIKSRRGEVEFAPRIEAVINGSNIPITVTMDAMLSAGSNVNKSSDELTAGVPDILKVAESATSIGKGPNPVDHNTFRTYLRFDLSKHIRPGDKVSKVVLKLYARNNGGIKNKEMLLFSLGSNVWDGSLKWTDTSVQHTIYSFDGEDAPNWQVSTPNTHYTVNENPASMGGFFDCLSYSVLNDEPDALYQYMRRSMAYIHSYRKPQEGGSPSLRTASRLTTFSDSMRYWIDSYDVVPTDVFVGVLKHIWSLLDYFEQEENFTSGMNFGIYQSRGLVGGALHFEEDFERGKYWVDLALARFVLLTESTMFSDGSSVEAGMAYTRDSISLLLSPFEHIENVGRDVATFPFPNEFKDNLLMHAKYVMDMMYNFRDPQYGDTTNHLTDSFRLGNLMKRFPDQNFLWVSTNGAKGTQPDYTSVFYPEGGKIVMRSDWSGNGLYMHTNNDRFHYTHGHDDDMSVIVFAYGQYLLVDPLYYTYTAEPNRLWLVGKNGHNLVVINKHNGQAGQRSSTNWGYDEIGPMNHWETNAGFDFISMEENRVPASGAPGSGGVDVGHMRDVLFVKDKFWIVTDLLTPLDKAAPNRYEQRWHFLPEAKIKMDKETMTLESTAFAANIKLFPVGTEDYRPVNNYDEDSSGIQKGLYSNAAGHLVNADYAYFLKDGIQGDTTFNTVLFPMTRNEDYSVETRDIVTNLRPTQAAAFQLDYTKKSTNWTTTGFYYNLLDRSVSGENTIETLATDGQMFYTELSGGNWESLNFARGTYLKDNTVNTELIKSNSFIDALSVQWQGNNIYLDCMDEVDLSGLTVYTNRKVISEVHYKGSSVPFKQQGKYVYFGANPIIPDNTVIKPPINDSSDDKQTNKHGNLPTGGGSVNPPVTPPVDPPVGTPRYTDVSPDRWSNEYIEKLSQLGILSGFADGTFLPEANITREEFVKVVLEAFEIPLEKGLDNPFDDVESMAWYEDYVKTGAKLGIIKGISDTGFGVGERLARQDIAVIITRVLDYLDINFPDIGTRNEEFSDSDSIASYAMTAVLELAGQDIITGNENKEFMPNAPATREQIAKIIYLTLEKLMIIE